MTEYNEIYSVKFFVNFLSKMHAIMGGKLEIKKYITTPVNRWRIRKFKISS